MAISTVELHTLYLIPFRRIPFWSIPGTIPVSILLEFIVPGMAIWQNCLPNYIPPDSAGFRQESQGEDKDLLKTLKMIKI